MKRDKHINRLIHSVEAKTGWGNVMNWSDRKYQEICDLIFDASQIQISIATLKRITGKIETAEDYEPSESSLDAISVYLGYKGWYSFRKPAGKVKVNRSFIYISLAVIFLLAGAYLSWRFIQPGIDEDKYSFSVTNPTGMVPHTALINYQIPNNNKVETILDFNYFSNQEDDRTEKLLFPDNNTLTHLFTYPDYYHVEMKANGTIVDQSTIHVLSGDWKALYVTNRKKNRILLDYPAKRNGKLHVPKKTIDSLLQINEYEQSWLFYINSDTFNIDCSNLILETRIRSQSKAEIETGCHFGEINLITDNGAIMARFCDPGCHKWIKLQAGKEFLNGEYQDLSMFTNDMHQWVDIKVENVGQVARYYKNDSLIYEIPYQEPLGDLKVIEFDFTVSGEVDFIKLTNSRGNVLYEDDFK